MNLKKSKTAKLFAGAIGLGMALSFALPVGAQTTAELTAQINSLLAMIAQLQAQLGTTGGSASFNVNLTVGSTGADVTALQQWLVSKGYMSAPAAYGYFGNLTKAALAKYQAAAGISPAVGYFGPITRAKINAMGGTTTGGTTTGSTGITTPGVEGTISVTSSNAGLPSTLYVGDMGAGVLGFKVEAKNSDVAIQRIKLDVGTSTSFYNKVFKKAYVTVDGSVVASVDLNSSTVSKDGSRYYVTIAGFNVVVPKNGSKVVVIKMDLYSSIDSTQRYADPIRLASNGVRGIDGAGIDQYAGDTSITKTPSISASLADSASLTVTLNSATPKLQDVVCSSGSSSDQCDLMTVLVFDVKAEKDSVYITDLQLAIAKTASGAAAANASTTLYIYEGSTQIANASVSGDTAILSSFNQTIAKDATKTYTVKTDIRSATAARASFVASASSTGITAENSTGTTVTTKSGTATGYAQGVRKTGAIVTLVSKSITTSGAPQTSGANNGATSTLTATFNVNIKAVGGPIMLGTVASGTPTFASSTAGFKFYINGAAGTQPSSYATSTSFTIPTTCLTSGLSNSCTLAEGSEVTIPVTFTIQGRNGTAALTSGLYALGLESVWWIDELGGAQTTTFMAGETDWRTSDVSFP